MYLYKSLNKINKGVISLFISYTLSFIAIGFSYIAYSKLLSPPGIWPLFHCLSDRDVRHPGFGWRIKDDNYKRRPMS